MHIHSCASSCARRICNAIKLLLCAMYTSQLAVEDVTLVLVVSHGILLLVVVLLGLGDVVLLLFGVVLLLLLLSSHSLVVVGFC